ncbi:hypothetical protein D1AOALGA4SA_7850 [Olavius algarvensis Delta 1 endosymbiont]|nr:hypothetical protein D1AOALGA4SA_7850 [Olavius algarvensis Delta 1 endosymbiont]
MSSTTSRIRYPVSTIQYPETSIQDQSLLRMVSIAAAMFDFEILCNYGMKPDE